MNDEIDQFLDEVDETIQQATRMCYMTRAMEYQRSAVEAVQQCITKAETLKRLSVQQQGDENIANMLLSITEVLAAISHELQLWIALKLDLTNEAWDHLVAAEQSARTAMQVHDVANCFGAYVEHLALLERTLFPPLTFFSAGFVVDSAECSICGEEYGECEHIRGKAYMGELCVRRIRHIKELREVSIVEKPANKHCRIVSATVDGAVRDILTWRETDRPLSELAAESRDTRTSA